MTPGQYVFFDVDGTLVEWMVDWAEVFAQVAGEAGLAVTREQAWRELSAAFNGLYPESIRKHARSANLREFWLDYDGQILASLGVTQAVRRHAARTAELLGDPAAIRLYPEVPAVLEELASRGARLGVISGRPLVSPDLERLGIGHHFALVVDAFHAGGPKSEGRMFRIAAEAAMREGLVAWHVGDSYQDDVQGARAAGLRPVLLDRKGRHPQADCPRITDLCSLLEVN